MGKIIAFANQKGGVGKTTLCGMLIQYLCEKGKGPILAVDADANSNLNAESAFCCATLTRRAMRPQASASIRVLSKHRSMI